LATPLRLRVFKAGAQIDCKDFDCSIIKIGRLSAAQLCLDDDKVSRIHAVIDVAVDGKFSIIDMGSVEGTFVNGKRINRGELRFGDEIRVGNTSIRVEDAAAEQTLPPTLRGAAAALPVVDELPAIATSTVPEIEDIALPVAPLTPVDVLPGPAAVLPPAFPVARAASVAQAAPVFQAVPVAQALPVARAVPVAQAVQAAPVPQAAPVAPKDVIVQSAVRSPRRGSSRDGGPLGLAIRLKWGDQPLESHYFPPSEQARFSVGTAAGVHFPMGDALLRGNRLDVVSFNKGHASVQFTEKMDGEFYASGKPPMRLADAVQARIATRGSGAYSIDLRDSDFMWVHLGNNIILEAHLDTKPKPAWVPFLNRIDFAALNIFLVVALLGSLFMISALNAAKRGADLIDELSTNDARLVKLIEQSPEIQKTIQRKFENIQKSNPGEAAARAHGTEGEMGRKNTTEKDGKSIPKGNVNESDLQRNALSALLGSGVGGGAGATALGHGRGGDVRAALGGLQGTRYGDAAGRGGLGISGVGSGGGGTSLSSIGVGGTGTKSGASFGAGGGTPGLAGRARNEVPTLTTGQATVEGNIDGELIRQVIRRNSAQIRACYEEQLIRFPQLEGRVAIRFVINSEGTVDSSKVNHSAMTPRNTEIGNCVANKIRLLEFPRPRGGGTAQVTYPFIFKPAG